jgi:rare lipoprotein A
MICLNNKLAPSRLMGAFVLVLSVFVASCSTTPSQTTKPAPSGATKPAPPSQPGATSRAGGYYQDDGPGANPPDINSIPDAVPRAENLATRANRPYVVFGQSYQPMAALSPFKQRGMASWYGRKFHGQKTSNGEVYDMYGMTAAHPTLPLPSYVRVTLVRTGKSVVVRVNDRGPFLQQRVIDLSYTAAAKLGYINAGSAEVEVELITRFDGVAPPIVASTPSAPVSTPNTPTPIAESVQPNERLTIETVVAANTPEPPITPAPSSVPRSTPVPVSTPVPATGLFLQMGAFGTQDTAEVAKDRMMHQFDNVAEPFRVVKDGTLFKVHLGPFTSREAATATAEKIKQATAFKPFTVSRPQ